MDEPDYVTLVPAVAHGKFLVAVMRYQSSQDGFYQFRISREPIPKPAAEALARSWAAAMHLEIR